MKALTREFGPRSPVSSEESAKSFQKSSEWECRAIPANYAFGPFRLDAQGETLFRGTERVALSRRAVALLRILTTGEGFACLLCVGLPRSGPCLLVARPARGCAPQS